MTGYWAHCSTHFKNTDGSTFKVTFEVNPHAPVEE
jgi:hypothetical protein